VNFRYRDVLAAGPIVRDFSVNFDAYWNSQLAYPIDFLAPDLEKEPDWSALAAEARAITSVPGPAGLSPLSPNAARSTMEKSLPQLTWAKAELIFDPTNLAADDAGDTPKVTAQTLGRLVAQAKSEILVESAYFILGDAQLETLAPILGRGVRFAVTTNSLASNDLTTNHSGYARHREAMLEKGLELHELRPDAAACTTWIESPGYCARGKVSLHAKSMVFDRKVLYVGSFNINLRSTYLNSETVLVIHSPELAARVARDIETGMQPENSWQVSRDADGDLFWSAADGSRWTHEPDTGFWRRCKSGFFSWLSVEKYL